MNILDHYKQSHDLRASEDYEVSINDQGARLGAPAPVEGRFFYPEGDAPRPQYEGDMLERTGQALEDVGQTAKSMAVGAGAGMAGLPGDVVALTGGLARLLFPGDEGRIQGATDTITKISEAIGSERILGLYRDLVNESDMSAEDKQMALDAAETGSFLSIPGVGATAAVGKDAIKEGVVKAGQAADARIADRAADTGVTLAAGADPMPAVDAAISAAGRAVRTNRAEDVLRAKYPNVELDVSENAKGLILSKIVVPDGQRSSGVGSAVMSDLVSYADSKGLPLAVTPDSIFGGSKGRLEDFYKRFGFVRNKGRNKDFAFRETFVRQPKADPNQAAGAAMDLAQVRYFETGKFEPPTAENPVSVVKPTEQEPGIIAFHGSGADFDEFRLEMIGTGEGAQAYGYGLYFTDSEDIAKFYRDTVSNERSVKLDYDGNEDAAKALQGNAPAMFEDGYKTYVFGDAEDVIYDALTVQRGKAPSESYLNNQVMAFDMNGVLSIDMPDGTSLSLLKTFSGDRFTATPISSKQSGKTYKVGLAPKPDELLDYQTTFAEQPKKVQDALKAIGYEVETDRAGLKNPPIVVEAAMTRPMPMVLNYMKGVVSDTAKAPINKEISSINDKMRSLAKIMDEYEISYRKYSDPKGQEAAEEYDQLMDKRQELVNKMASSSRADKLLSEKLSEQGVPGIKYRAAGSRGANVDAADAEMNYVIFDDKAVKILEKYGIVGPVAVTAGAASQTDTEADDGKTT